MTDHPKTFDKGEKRLNPTTISGLCRERANSYGVLRQSALSAVVLDTAAAHIDAQDARIAELEAERNAAREEGARAMQRACARLAGVAVKQNRLAGLLGLRDPLEVDLLDKNFSDLADAIRSLDPRQSRSQTDA